MPEVNPFRRDPVVVEAKGFGVVAIPYAPASDWIMAVLTGGPDTMVHTLCRAKDRAPLIDALINDVITAEDLSQASYDALDSVAPFRWWETTRLIMLSAAQAFTGRTVVAGMDPSALTIGQWCAGVYHLATENADDKGKFKFDAMLSDPPAGVEDDDDWGTGDSAALFAAARSMPGQK
jgi:hypothetical protein